jgi:soluble lytic murein transglycosylase-like protein
MFICHHSHGQGENFETAALTPGTEMLRQSDLPTVLADDDIARYRRIFADEARADWAKADAEIARLGAPLLLGQVLAARYLSKAYHSSYPELVSWLGRYADEPDAKAIYRLALYRQPHGAKAPPRPMAAALDDGDASDFPDTDLSPRAVLVVRQIERVIPTAPGRAEHLLAGPEAQHMLDKVARATLRAEIAASYLRAGEPQQALGVSAPAAVDGDDDGESATTNWEAGLAAWKLGRFAEARDHFEAVVRDQPGSTWLKSGAAFWSARVAQRMHKPRLVTYWLGIAAEEPRTFYGLIADRLLGADPGLDFDPEPFSALDARVITSLEAGRRALALLAVGERGRAVVELRALMAGHNPALLQSLAGIAQRAKLAGLSMEIGRMLAAADGRRHDGAVYPLPRWVPRCGFTVDRALLYALMRQESLFLPGSTSTAGARGVMQLMPGTARDMAAREGMPLAANDNEDERALADPTVNLSLAQEYVRLLLKNARIKDNLLFFALAYNAGPSTWQRWQDLAVSYRRDPLLFLESIPSPETRLFTKHVLTNFWIYRTRLGEPTPELDELAAGKWPTYTAPDTVGPDNRYAAN